MFKGIHSTHAPKAIGPYSPAVKLGDFVYLSGQLPIDPQTNQLVSGGIYEQTYQVLRNMEAVLQEMNLELRHIVKTTVFVTDLNDFSRFNEIYATIFQDPYPARSTVQVAALPLGAMVEVEALVIDTLAYEAQLRHQHHHHDHGHGECGCGGHHHHDDEKCGCGKLKEDCHCKENCDDDCGCNDK